MSYPFVQALYHGPAGSFRQLRALTVHHAEGGGTVSWLQHPTNANSSHFVIEYSGRIVQMVADDQYDYSLHVARPYGPPGPGDFGIYSLDRARDVLGDGISDPNRYMYAVELEGYAATGPNAAQVAALGRLVADLRSRYPSMRGLLGHRDFQNYKPCPGGLIPWPVLGGHGLFGIAPAPAPQPKWAFDHLERLAEGTHFATTRNVNVWDPNRPSKPVATLLPTSVLVTWRLGIVWTDYGAVRPVPNGYPFVQIAEGPYLNCVLVEADGVVVPPAPAVPPATEQPPAEQPLIPPPFPSKPRSTRLPGGIEII